MSAIMHELILFFVLGFFFPALLITFVGPGIILIRKTKNASKHQINHILFWLEMYLGTSLIITLYLSEFYARYQIDSAPI